MHELAASMPLTEFYEWVAHLHLNREEQQAAENRS